MPRCFILSEGLSGVNARRSRSHCRRLGRCGLRHGATANGATMVSLSLINTPPDCGQACTPGHLFVITTIVYPCKTPAAQSGRCTLPGLFRAPCGRGALRTAALPPQTTNAAKSQGWPPRSAQANLAPATAITAPVAMHSHAPGGASMKGAAESRTFCSFFVLCGGASSLLKAGGWRRHAVVCMSAVNQ